MTNIIPYQKDFLPLNLFHTILSSLSLLKKELVKVQLSVNAQEGPFLLVMEEIE